MLHGRVEIEKQEGSNGFSARSWDDLLRGGSARISPKKGDIITRCFEESIEHLSSKDPTFFRDRLPSNQFWT